MDNAPTIPEPELELLGCCFDDPTAITDLFHLVQDPQSLFSSPETLEAWTVILELYERGIRDQIDISAALKLSKNVPMLTWAAISNSGTHKAMLPELVEKFTQERTRTDLLKLADRVQALSGAGKEGLTESIKQVQSFDPAPLAKRLTLQDSWLKLIGKMEHAHQHQGKPTGLKTGLHDLDQVTWGLQEQGLTIIGARPSQGKTSFLVTLLANMCVTQSIPTLFLSMESSQDEILARLMCCLTGLDMNKVRKGLLSERDFAKITAIQPKILAAPLHFEDKAGMTPAYAQSLISQHVHANGIKLVMVDYLQKFKADASNASLNRTYQIGDGSEGLKESAKKHNLHVVAAAQLKRDYDNSDRAPSLGDLGDSGQLERDGDIIGLLQRGEQTEAGLDCFLHLRKNRDGSPGTLSLHYEPSHFRFSSFEPPRIQNQP